MTQSPARVEVVSMFEKPGVHPNNLVGRPNNQTDNEVFDPSMVDNIEVGMRIADEFVVGYCLDWKDSAGISRYRGLPYVTIARRVVDIDEYRRLRPKVHIPSGTTTVDNLPDLYVPYVGYDQVG